MKKENYLFVTKDEVVDLCNILKEENKISFMELKNRIDSGGTAARREIYNTKFRAILNNLFIDEKLIPKDRIKTEYLLDIVYFLMASDNIY